MVDIVNFHLKFCSKRVGHGYLVQHYQLPQQTLEREESVLFPMFLQQEVKDVLGRLEILFGFLEELAGIRLLQQMVSLENIQV